MTFNTGLKPSTGQNSPESSSLWFVFNQGRLLIKKSTAGYEIPDTENIAAVLPTPDRHFFSGN